MRRILLCITAALTLCCTAWGQGLLDRCKRCTTEFQGIEREYYLYEPGNGSFAADSNGSNGSNGNDTRNTSSMPLVMALHGYGGSPASIPAALLDAADRHGFAVCIPAGTKDPKGKASWNVKYPSQDGMETDDVAFICALAKELQKANGYNPKATFLTGMSNGGEMCYLTAMREPKAFTAIASIAGLTMEWMAEDYKQTGPVPFMEVHGTQDHTSEWFGDPENEGGWGAYLPVPKAVMRVIAADRCRNLDIEMVPQKEGRNQVVLYKYTDGRKTKAGKPMQVWLYEVQGGNHSWSLKDLDTCEEMWKFFSIWM